MNASFGRISPHCEDYSRHTRKQTMHESFVGPLEFPTVEFLSSFCISRRGHVKLQLTRHRKENSSTRRSAATARAVGRPENPEGGRVSKCNKQRASTDKLRAAIDVGPKQYLPKHH